MDLEERVKRKTLKQCRSQEFPGNPEVRTWHFHCWGPGSIPSQGTKILQTTVVKKEKKSVDSASPSDHFLKYQRGRKETLSQRLASVIQMKEETKLGCWSYEKKHFNGLVSWVGPYL